MLKSTFSQEHINIVKRETEREERQDEMVLEEASTGRC